MKNRMVAGLLGGFSGSVLMLFSIQVTDMVVIDMRNIALIITTMFAGPVASIITAVFMIVYRLITFDVTVASVVACFVLAALCISCVLIVQMKRFSSKQKYGMMIGLSVVYTCVAFVILIEDRVQLLTILISYSFTLVLIATISYYVAEYLQKSTELFRRYEHESKVDYLTGLYNKREFDLLLHNHLKKA